ncbi:hypothetical protein ACIQRS_06375 [Streptomyces termitum]|uniref:Uncharacterized protein n=1 Tax=Streptomyces termitum TaxID=67368 RepID=A0A918W8B1_9ACTN|nr:hypothetical protein [Streptomyces termitum]GHA75592.1 hypothetical protein GCM10010305_17870 [Streptomyces termitum]
MKVCRVERRLPYAALLCTLHAAGATEDEYPPRHEAASRCELSREHDGPHIAHLYSRGTDPELWAQWEGEDDEIRFVHHLPCVEPSPHADPIHRWACTLPADHDGGHSWEAEGYDIGPDEGPLYVP